jgi:predicted amidohydrolase
VQAKAPKAPLKVAIVQLTSTDNLEKNVELISAQLRTLQGQKLDLIVLPENALYLRLDKSKPLTVLLNLREKFWADWQKFCAAEKVHLLIGSVPYKGSGRKPTNAMVLLAPGKKPKVVYEKIHLFDVDVKGAPPSRESEHFRHGNKPAILKIRDWKLGLSICYDVRFSELYRRYAKAGVHVLVVPAAFLVPTGRAHWHVLLRARAIESQAYVLAPAQSGGHRSDTGHTRDTYGHSLVVEPWGEVLCDLGDAGTAVEVVELSPDHLARVYAQIPQAGHRRL